MIIAVTFFWGIIGLGAPSTDYDSTVYHLTLPKLYAAEEGFVPRPDIIQSRYPQNLAGIHTLAYQWGGEGAVEFLNLITCALLLWLLVELLTLIDSQNRWKMWSVIVVVSSFQFIFYLYDAGVEGWLAYLTLCLYTCILLITEETNPFFLIVLSLLGGCLIGIKPTSSPPVILGLLFGFIRFYGFHGRISWTVWLAAFLSVIVLGTFWYVIVFLLHGNLYAKGIMGEGNALISFNRLQLSNIFTVLKSLVIYNLPTIIYIFIIPYSVKNRMGKVIFIVFISTSFTLLVTNPWGYAFFRYIYPIFPLIVIGIVIGLAQMESIDTRGCRIFRYTVFFVLISSLILTQAANIYRNSRKTLVAFRINDKNEYLASRVNTYRTIQLANSVVPSNGMLFMVGERSYWLNIPYVLGISRNPSVAYDKMTPDNFFELLKNYKATHLIFSDEPTDKTSEFLKFWASYPGLKFDRRLKLLHHDIWNSSTGTRNSYLYEVVSLPLRAESKGDL